MWNTCLPGNVGSFQSCCSCCSFPEADGQVTRHNLPNVLCCHECMCVLSNGGTGQDRHWCGTGSLPWEWDNSAPCAAGCSACAHRAIENSIGQARMMFIKWGKTERNKLLFFKTVGSTGRKGSCKLPLCAIETGVWLDIQTTYTREMPPNRCVHALENSSPLPLAQCRPSEELPVVEHAL